MTSMEEFTKVMKTHLSLSAKLKLNEFEHNKDKFNRESSGSSLYVPS